MFYLLWSNIFKAREKKSDMNVRINENFKFATLFLWPLETALSLPVLPGDQTWTAPVTKSTAADKILTAAA